VRALLPLLPKPSQYSGLEDGAARKDARSVRLHCALAFPDRYEVGMSYLGQKILYGLLNARQDCLAERVFAPCREAGKILREHKTPLATLESDTPLARLHMLGFSITHELCYTNVLYMLDLAGIPLRCAQRGDNLRDWPLVVAGGGCTLNAEPLVPFMDLMCLGDGEAVLPQLVNLLIEARELGWSRRHFLEESRHIPGVYVPSLFTERDGVLAPLFADYPKAVRRIVPDLDEAFYPTGQVVPIGAIHNRLALEIARGCTRGCRFCQAGMSCRPVRERSVPALEKLVDECLTETGFDELSFLALSAGDFSALKTLFANVADRCAAQQVALALPSLRVGSVDDSIMARMAGIRRTGATLAPEAGSQRLRDIINKGVTEDELVQHVQKLVQNGWRQVKLYFMIGLPGERREDLDAIFDLCGKARDAAGSGGPRVQVTAAVSPFVPKAHTPFQWEAQLTLEEMRERIGYLIGLFKRRKNLVLRWHEAQASSLEGVFSRGDRRLADVLERAYAKGAIFSNWMEGFSLTPWLEALEECGQRMEDWTGPRAPEAPLPWDHLESGLDPAFLLRERERALAGLPSPDCRFGACLQCGVCDSAMRPSRLRRADGEPAIRQWLNFAERDQQNRSPINNAEGRLVPPSRRAEPPRIAPELGVKAVCLRVWHRKEGRAAFLSQLDLQTVLERAMRRAGLPLSFSRGFHPLPLLSFGRALPVGVCSLAEWFSITLRERVAGEEVRRRLTHRLPDGMEILRVEETGTPTRQARSETFRIAHLGAAGEREAFLKKWREFARQKSRIWTRATKKGERSDDLRALVAKLEYDADGAVLCATDWSAGYLSPLTLARAVSEEENILKLAVTKLAQHFE
jgi:radical SAM family uncharacterized protein/radical SAM-linked protein